MEEPEGIFFSWSGDLSLNVAEKTKELLETVFPHLPMFFSPKGMDKGKVWQEQITRVLSQHSRGLFFVTRSNMNSPFMQYELGSIAKSNSKGFAIPVLIDLSERDIGLPLSLFQSTRIEKSDFLKLIDDINNSLSNPLPLSVIHRSLEIQWEHFEIEISKLISIDKSFDESSLSVIPSIHDWVSQIARNDPEHGSYSFGDCVIFDQAPWGESYELNNVKSLTTGLSQQISPELSSVVTKYVNHQIGDNLPHYSICSFRRSSSDYRGVEIEFCRSWYMDVRSIHAALQDSPTQIVTSSGKSLVDYLVAANPLDFRKALIPSQFSVNAAVIVKSPGKEALLLIAQRGAESQVGYFPRSWSCTFQETIAAGAGVLGNRGPNDATIFECVERGLKEELVGDDVKADYIGFQCFFIEGQIFNQSSVAIVEVPISFADICRRRRFLADDSVESGTIIGIPVRPDAIVRLLDQPQFDADFAINVGAIDPTGPPQLLQRDFEWHPSSRLSLYMVLRKYFPNDAKRWLQSKIGF